MALVTAKQSSPLVEGADRNCNAAGNRLQRFRKRLGLTTRQVAELSRAVAERQSSEDYYISHARLVQVEGGGSIPSIHKLFTLSAIYGVPMLELLSTYFEPEDAGALHASMPLPQTHLVSFESQTRKSVPAPAAAPPIASLAETSLLSRTARVWEQVPAWLLDKLSARKCVYGFIGLSDFTMHPLIRPGAIVQIEECSKIAAPAQYRTEYDRPIYFVELRSGYICSWCELNHNRLLSIPHPLSPCRPREFTMPSQAELVGRVVAVAARLVDTPAANRVSELRTAAAPSVGNASV
jgi:transcriptional regulator with XRE-family HTH domain